MVRVEANGGKAAIFLEGSTADVLVEATAAVAALFNGIRKNDPEGAAIFAAGVLSGAPFTGIGVREDEEGTEELRRYMQ